MTRPPALLVTLVLGGLIASGCVARPNVAPTSPLPLVAPSAAIVASTPAATRSPRPMRSGPLPKDVGCADIIARKPGHYPDPTVPPAPAPTISGGDAESKAAITIAADALARLRSYQFSVDVIGRDLSTLQGTTFDFATRGTVDRSNDLAIDAIFGSRLREGNGSGAVSSGGQQIKAGHGLVWGADNVSGVLEPMRGQAGPALISLLTPEGAAGRFVIPFAAGYRQVGSERHAGVATEHYRASAKGKSAYAATMQFKGPLTADLWIAKDGGYLAGARVTGKSSHIDPTYKLEVDDGFVLAFEITHANDPNNVVTLPATPLPDPVRPTKAPVDLLLEYRIQPKDGRLVPTSPELDDIGVALRTRLDTYTRPIKVDIVGMKVVVTVCGTTNPDADRRLITSSGALTVVPLPTDRYGTAARAGPTALPAAGSPIDTSLEPIAPPSRLGQTTAHIDPTTGRRGLAFRLNNQASEAFTAYAAKHPNEFVAVVLDGTVLATIPIDARTAKGNFVFTGDYTEAESRLLASYLYRDPILFELRPIEDVEIPAHE
jgi:SecD-like export protein